ncbi:MAG: cache domain-containing protein [Arenimonas sp.]|nr:cache domain-containing protein [Arenimonas sp.]
MPFRIRTALSPSLAFITMAFVLTSAVIGLVMAYVLINERGRAYEAARLTMAVETRMRGVQTAMAQSLHREWLNLLAVRGKLAVLRPQDLQTQLDTLVGGGSVVSWAGYAQSDGTVVSASGGLLVGESVEQRPWFREGLKGTFAGDAHEALLLAARLPPPAAGAPLQFLDLAAPVSDADGSTVGVLGLHLNVAWAQRMLEELAASMGVDIFVVGADGAVVASSTGDKTASLDLPSFRMARSGASGSGVETWPDGRTYFTTTVPELSYADLPRFGWNLVARIDGDYAALPARILSRDLMLRLAGFALILALLTLLFIVAFIRPFADLARNAVEIAEGRDVYPLESHRTRELGMIGAALARLQSAAHPHDMPQAGENEDRASDVQDAKAPRPARRTAGSR